MRERVFVVDRDAFFDGRWPHGFVPLPDAAAFLARALATGRFVDRDEAEANPAWKQWIPYCVLRCGDWSPGAEGARGGDRGVLLVQRTRGQRDTALHASWSVGLGGHVGPADAPGGDGSPAAPDASSFFASALRRELAEELFLPEDAFELPEPQLVGLINDDSTAVGRVHAGLAYRLDLPLPLGRARECVGIREISKMRGGFASLVEVAKLWQDRAQFESWSRFFIEAEVLGAMGGRSWNGPTSVTDLAGLDT